MPKNGNPIPTSVRRLGWELSAFPKVEGPLMTAENQTLDQVLEAAVVVSWTDLMPDDPSGVVHIEYGFAPGGTVDYLRVWLSTKPGEWLLACSYWMSPSNFHDTGIHFNKACQSDGLAHILAAVMQNQSAFALPSTEGRQGLLQIAFPTQDESAAAIGSVSAAFGRVDRAIAEPVLA